MAITPVAEENWRPRTSSAQQSARRSDALAILDHGRWRLGVANPRVDVRNREVTQATGPAGARSTAAPLATRGRRDPGRGAASARADRTRTVTAQEHLHPAHRPAQPQLAGDGRHRATLRCRSARRRTAPSTARASCGRPVDQCVGDELEPLTQTGTCGAGFGVVGQLDAGVSHRLHAEEGHPVAAPIAGRRAVALLPLAPLPGLAHRRQHPGGHDLVVHRPPRHRPQRRPRVRAVRIDSVVSACHTFCHAAARLRTRDVAQPFSSQHRPTKARAGRQERARGGAVNPRRR
jgi:hypothetical protein